MMQRNLTLPNLNPKKELTSPFRVESACFVKAWTISAALDGVWLFFSGFPTKLEHLLKHHPAND